MARPPNHDPRRDQYERRLHLDSVRVRKLTPKIMDRLDSCANDTARRLILLGYDHGRGEEKEEGNEG
jgi:hypothetical protein